jgi:hypothetical protein
MRFQQALIKPIWTAVFSLKPSIDVLNLKRLATLVSVLVSLNTGFVVHFH